MGIYFHIPFCISRCAYCDFYSTTAIGLQEAYVAALLQEIQKRLNTTFTIRTVYFGGGTPSCMKNEYISLLINELYRCGSVAEDCEITLEANPDDLNSQKIKEYKTMNINRLSIGIQSFNDIFLRKLGRRHSGKQAREAVLTTQDAGMQNISIDLMYALPDQTFSQWREDVAQSLSLNVPHISTYCLTYEDGTPLTKQLRLSKIKNADEQTANEMYDMVCGRLKSAGYEHYEVSNFAQPNFRSRHNSNYWNETPYIGLGAAAHSYDGVCREWNVADVKKYIEATTREKEILTPENRYNERVMLGLRTCEGIAIEPVNEAKIAAFVRDGLLRRKNGRAVATQKGLHILNYIIEALMI